MDAKSHDSGYDERAEDISWHIEAAEQLEVFCIYMERLDAAVDRKLILMHEEQQNNAVHGHWPRATTQSVAGSHQ